MFATTCAAPVSAVKSGIAGLVVELVSCMSRHAVAALDRVHAALSADGHRERSSGVAERVRGRVAWRFGGVHVVWRGAGSHVSDSTRRGLGTHERDMPATAVVDLESGA